MKQESEIIELIESTRHDLGSIRSAARLIADSLKEGNENESALAKIAELMHERLEAIATRLERVPDGVGEHK